MAGVVAMSAIGSVLAVTFAIGASVLYISNAWPQELAATAPIPQPRPPEPPAIFKAPVELTCLPFKTAEAELHKLGRFNIGGGISSKELVTLFYATPDLREWTILTLAANGTACILVSGSYLDFKQIEKRAA